jgi:hypothetical protein
MYADEHAGKKVRCQKCKQSFHLSSGIPGSKPDPAKTVVAKEGYDSYEAGASPEPAEQAGGLLNEEEALKSLRSRILEVAAEYWRYVSMYPNPHSLIPKGQEVAHRLMMVAGTIDRVNRQIDSEPPERRIAIAKQVLDEYEEMLADAKKRFARRVRKGVWNLALFAIMGLAVLGMVLEITVLPMSGLGCSGLVAIVVAAFLLWFINWYLP